MHIYDIAVVGAGPAGIMAAIRASQPKKEVVLIERNDRIGKKVLITGKGRCNVTNMASIDTFIEKFGKNGRFLRSAFHAFFNEDLISFFESRGLKLKVERQGRVFPETDKAESILEILKKTLKNSNLKIFHDMCVVDIRRKDNLFELQVSHDNRVYARKAVLSTGGASYKKTGSAGDGFRIAKKMGHTISPIMPALVPLKTQEPWVKQLQGLTLRKTQLTFVYNKKKIRSEIGDMLFTHFGVSGPLALDLSGDIVSLVKGHKKVSLFIDLKPGLNHEMLKNKFVREFTDKGKVYYKNFLKDLLPSKLIPVFMSLSKIDSEKIVSQITKDERIKICSLLKAFPLTIAGSLDIEYAMVTNGGVSTKEINPRTMESRLVNGLYFAGEIIDGCASSGGYNLQQAFSTGYLAGEKAAYA